MKEEVTKQEREERREVLEELKEFAYEKAPEPKEDWDLVWVLSGPAIDIAEDFKEKGKKVLFGYDDEISKNDIAKGVNESKRRFETGISIAKRVTALRLNKKVEDVTKEDISMSGPEIFWNATDWANDNMRQRIEEGFLNDYNFPSEKVVVSPNLGIEHTGHQFERFDEGLVDNARKVVIVSDTYHLPRVEEYIDKKDSKVPKDKVVLFPAEPRQVPVGKALSEIKKIPKYKKRGIL